MGRVNNQQKSCSNAATPDILRNILKSWGEAARKTNALVLPALLHATAPFWGAPSSQEPEQ